MAITVTLPRATTNWLFALRISFYSLLLLFTFNLPTAPSDAAKDDFPKYSYVKKVYKAVKSYDWHGSCFRDYSKLYENSLVLHSEVNALEEEDILKKLPSEYEQIYDELLEIYSAEELELLREQHGDQILYQIYIDEYGPFYAEQDRRSV